jgi:hypothetical protein
LNLKETNRMKIDKGCNCNNILYRMSNTEVHKNCSTCAVHGACLLYRSMVMDRALSLLMEGTPNSSIKNIKTRLALLFFWHSNHDKSDGASHIITIL